MIVATENDGGGARPVTALFAYSLIPFSVEELGDGVRESADVGFAGVEITNDHLDAMTPAQRRNLRRALDATGTRLAAAGVGFLGFDGGVEKRARLACDLGAERLVWLPPLRGMATWPDVASELDALYGRRAELGVAASCHVHTGTLVEDQSDAVELTGAHPDVSLCFDTGHSALFGDLEGFVEALGPRIDHVHVRGLRRPPDVVLAGYLPERRDLRVLIRLGEDLVPPGTGVLELDRVLRALRSKPWWVVELEASEDPVRHDQMVAGHEFLARFA